VCVCVCVCVCDCVCVCVCCPTATRNVLPLKTEPLLSRRLAARRRRLLLLGPYKSHPVRARIANLGRVRDPVRNGEIGGDIPLLVERARERERRRRRRRVGDG